MLTWDLVRAKVGRDSVTVRELQPAQRARALELAGAYIDCLEAGRGRLRTEVTEELGRVPVGARERKIADGLKKLLDDRCTWEQPDGPEAAELRRAVFTLAARRRREQGPGEPFDRDAVLVEAGAGFGLDAAATEDALFADLPSARRLVAFQSSTPEELLRTYEAANRQALLLRATRVEVDLRAASPAGTRGLFRRLKFLQLLHEIHPIEGGYRLRIEGPYALFQQVTKYGLKLAMLVPLLESAGSWTLRAEVLWGPQRVPKILHLEGEGGAAAGPDRLPDELARLVADWDKLESGWTVAPASAVLELPGVGLCVPDLVFRHPERGRVFFELMGYWSREAVWKRVDLVQAGLPEPIVFAASARLRVSEAVLEEEESGALYVFKGVLAPKAVLARLERVAAPPRLL